MRVRLIFRLSAPRLFAARDKVVFLPPMPRTVSAPAFDWPLDVNAGARPRSALGGGVWAVEAAHGRVECPHELLQRIGNDAMAGFVTAPAGGPEIGGVLYGAKTGGRVQVMSYGPLECGHEKGPDFSLSAGDEQKLQELLADPEPSLAPVGWYFSQYQNLRLSREAMALHDRYFGERWQVVLVFGRSRTQALRIGLFARNADGKLDPAPDQELTVDATCRMEPAGETAEPASAVLRQTS